MGMKRDIQIKDIISKLNIEDEKLISVEGNGEVYESDPKIKIKYRRRAWYTYDYNYGYKNNMPSRNIFKDLFFPKHYHNPVVFRFLGTVKPFKKDKTAGTHLYLFHRGLVTRFKKGYPTYPPINTKEK